MPAIRKAFECHFHDRADVARYVEAALAIVEDAELPDDLRESAFGKAVDLLAHKQVTFEEVSGAGVLLNNAHRG